MLYRTNPRNGDSLSQLGFGCMRFPKKGGQIDMEKTTELIKASVELGVNYFDTAYIYPGSERALGRILENEGLRSAVKIATKLPLFMCKTAADFDKYFGKQLERLRTDRVDYYLMHMLGDIKAWERLKALGIEEWLKKKKAADSILNIGFSYHGGKQGFRELIDAYDWDFCMLQYNYLDENSQAGREGLQYASGKGLPVFIMEPLRGGTLAGGLPKRAKDVFEKADKDRSPACWALKWVWNHKEATLLLSGMGDISQLTENAAVADTSLAGSLAGAELSVYADALSVIRDKVRVACTGCGYCMPCPSGVDIPNCFSCYNESFTQGFVAGIRQYFMTAGMISAGQTHAGLCVGCKKCERHCPQSIEISKLMPIVSRRFGGAMLSGAMGLARRVMKIEVNRRKQ